MNIDKAKTIPLFDILRIMGHSPAKMTENDLWYVSPFRSENTPSLHVTVNKNQWYDFGDGRGGDGIAMVCEYLKLQDVDYTPSDALRWLSNMTGYSPVSIPPKALKKEKQSAWLLKKVKPITSVALINYLKTRGIALGLADKHLKEVYVRHTIKPMGLYALGLKNEDGGYELRNTFFKGSVNPKNITFTRAEEVNPQGINIFEGVLDFLSTATLYPDLVVKNDNIILNSVAMLEMAYPYIKGYGYKVLYDWMDNDNAGNIASNKISMFTSSQENLKHRPMQKLYALYKDVNEWHVSKLKLQLK
jgi:hypothetical protein